MLKSLRPSFYLFRPAWSYGRCSMPDLKTELQEKVVGPVVLDRPVFDEICLTVCPHCRKQWPLTQRLETGEWVHVNKTKVPNGESISQVICWANGFRKSRFAELVKNG